MYKQILIDGKLKTGKRGKKQSYWEKSTMEKKVRFGLVVLSKKEEEKEKESVLKVANFYLAESENMYFYINLKPTFVSDDVAGSSGWIKFILEGTWSTESTFLRKHRIFQ